MKTVISLPDKLVAAADALAAGLGVSRSCLVALALGDFINAHDSSQAVTERLNTVYATESTGLDASMRRIQHRAIRQPKW